MFVYWGSAGLFSPIQCNIHIHVFRLQNLIENSGASFLTVWFLHKVRMVQCLKLSCYILRVGRWRCTLFSRNEDIILFDEWHEWVSPQWGICLEFPLPFTPVKFCSLKFSCVFYFFLLSKSIYVLLFIIFIAVYGSTYIYKCAGISSNLHLGYSPTRISRKVKWIICAAAIQLTISAVSSRKILSL